MAKQRVLEDAGYTYNFDREVYVNRNTKKALSMDFIEEHDEIEIEEFISKKTDGKEWLFGFNSQPAAAVRRELETVLG